MYCVISVLILNTLKKSWFCTYKGLSRSADLAFGSLGLMIWKAKLIPDQALYAETLNTNPGVQDSKAPVNFVVADWSKCNCCCTGWLMSPNISGLVIICCSVVKLINKWFDFYPSVSYSQCVCVCEACSTAPIMQYCLALWVLQCIMLHSLWCDICCFIHSLPWLDYRLGIQDAPPPLISLECLSLGMRHYKICKIR